MSTLTCLLCGKYFIIIDGQKGFSSRLGACGGCGVLLDTKEVKSGSKEEKKG